MAHMLTEAQLDAYLARIGVERPARADLAALKAVHRAHVHGFTWEAIDCFTGNPNSVDPQETWAKMVEGRRGGWCYEMNGLLGAALSALGFAVTRLCGGVGAEDRGEMAIGNHLTLRVDLADGPWLAEVGLGDALAEPVPLAPGEVAQRGTRFAIEQADGGWWRFRNHPHGLARSFDFRPDYADEDRLEGMHAWLHEAEVSPFRNNLVVSRFFPGRIEAVLNRTHRTVTAQGAQERPIADAAELAALLAGTFRIDVPDVELLWDKAGRGQPDAFG